MMIDDDGDDDDDDDEDDDADTLDAVGRRGVADPPFWCNFKPSGQQTSFSSPFVVIFRRRISMDEIYENYFIWNHLPPLSLAVIPPFSPY